MNRKNESFDWLVKLLIIGDSAVGKTNILLRYCENTFHVSHLTTIVDVDGKKLKMQIWDTAGQDRFKTITQTYYKETWMKQIKMHASENVAKILVGNKCDMDERSVTKEEGEVLNFFYFKELAKSLGIPFFETSAKENINIVQMFETIATEIKERMTENDSNNGGGNNIQINQNVQGGKKKEKPDCC